MAGVRIKFAVTLFTRLNCSLCDDAKRQLSVLWEKRRFEYTEINVMEPAQERWKRLYEFDTPVVHVDRIAKLPTTEASSKLMHRFKAAEVEALMDEAAREATNEASNDVD
ncbi:hypothetical protein BJ546DRAFT_845174 [Cryomyces antarcticus]